MNIKFWNQPKNVSLEKILNEKLKKGFDEVLFVMGMAKDSGVDMVYDSLVEARNAGSNVSIYMGIDRKNTSKDMLTKLLNIGCNLNVHINKDEEKVETRIYVFENKNGESFVYMCGGKFSEGGLTTNNCLVEEIFYSEEDKKLFENFKAVLLQGVEEIFKQVSAEEIKLLAEKGEIVARIIDRKIPSINEMYGNASSIESISNQVYDETSGIKLFEIPENDVDIDIDIDFSGETKTVELAQEVEAKSEKMAEEKLAQLFNNEKEEVETKKVSIVKDSEDIDFSNVQIFVFETNKVIEKGLGEAEIKIPNYLYDSMPEFFGDSKTFEMIIDEKGKERFGRKINLKILDVSSGEEIADENAILFDAGKYFALRSTVIRNMALEENDIIRMIKNNNGFDVEVIRKTAKEYAIWEGFCKYTMKNSKRRFGIM